MKPGDLVRVEDHPDWKTQCHKLGIVIKIRPSACGGTSLGSYPSEPGPVVMHKSPVRDEILVLIPDTGSISWYDEIKLSVVEEEGG